MALTALWPAHSHRARPRNAAGWEGPAPRTLPVLSNKEAPATAGPDPEQATLSARQSTPPLAASKDLRQGPVVRRPEHLKSLRGNFYAAPCCQSGLTQGALGEKLGVFVDEGRTRRRRRFGGKRQETYDAATLESAIDDRREKGIVGFGKGIFILPLIRSLMILRPNTN